MTELEADTHELFSIRFKQYKGFTDIFLTKNGKDIGLSGSGNIRLIHENGDASHKGATESRTITVTPVNGNGPFELPEKEWGC